MKFAFATTFDALDVDNWSGTPLYMANGFTQEQISIDHIGGLIRHLPINFKFAQFLKKFFLNQRESPRFNIVAAKYYSEQVAKKLKKLKVNAVISPRINPIAYLDCQEPLILWTDALYASLLAFYPGFIHHSANSIEQGNQITRECLSRCRLAIFSSDWAARTALEIYGISKHKIQVVPFGANIQCKHTLDDIRHIIKSRSRDKIKLLFIGKHWERKGGDIVFNVAKSLHTAGYPIELNFMGSYPPLHVDIPPYIKCHGFISKRHPEGIENMSRLLRESHFLFVPSRAEAYGIVFCEANAFGLPCLTSYVGGIPSIVKDNMNGMKFALDSPIKTYCNYILDLMNNYARYEELALSSFNEYQTRLNWQVATRHVKSLITQL